MFTTAHIGLLIKPYFLQGLVGAIFEGVGVSTGSFIGGLLFASVGPGHTFEIFGVSAFIAFVVHVCLQMYLQRHHSSLDSDNGKQIPETEINPDNAIDALTITHINDSPHITATNSFEPLAVNNDDKTKFTNVDLNS